MIFGVRGTGPGDKLAYIFYTQHSIYAYSMTCGVEVIATDLCLKGLEFKFYNTVGIRQEKHSKFKALLYSCINTGSKASVKW